MSNPVQGVKELTDKEVSALHRNSDVDSRPEAQHHTLGTQRINASPGNHTHDGITSFALLSDNFTGSRSANTADILNQVMNALVNLGATNSTTA